MSRDRWVWDLIFMACIYGCLIYVGVQYARGQQQTQRRAAAVAEVHR